MPLPINGTFELRGVRFGDATSGYPLAVGGFEVDEGEVRTQDEDNPVDDGRFFGRDWYGGATYRFSLWIVETGPDKWVNASARLNTFKKLWRESPSRLYPGEVETLTIRHGGETSLVYGRPRRFKANREAIRHGEVLIVADFDAVDELLYDELPSSFSMDILPSSTGGVVAPLISPLVAQGSSQREGFAVVSGTAPTWPIVTFYGPITNPRLTLFNFWSLGLDGIVDVGDSVTIDTRPWRRTITRQDGASLSGMLSRETPPLQEVQLPPGSHELALFGTDGTGTATVDVAWRSTRHVA